MEPVRNIRHQLECDDLLQAHHAKQFEKKLTICAESRLIFQIYRSHEHLVMFMGINRNGKKMTS